MIIITNDLKSAIRRKKTWLAYDHDKLIAKMPSNTFMNELIDAYNRCVDTRSYSDYSTRGYTSSRYQTYADMVSSVYRPIDPRSIHVDYPNLRSDLGTYYWGFQ